MEIVGERLRILREREGKTQEDISKVLCTTQQIYSRYETAKTDLPLQHFCTLVRYYNVSSDYIMGNVTFPKIPPELSEPLIQNITIGDFICRINSFNSRSKKMLVDYVNYLTYQEKMDRKEKK